MRKTPLGEGSPPEKCRSAGLVWIAVVSFATLTGNPAGKRASILRHSAIFSGVANCATISMSQLSESV